jgi:hypothetical protein
MYYRGGKGMRSASRITVSTFGALMGLAGIEHGIGEVLQGNVHAEGLMFPSWPDSAFFRMVSGEPAMSVIPNMLTTGVLALLFSTAYVILAVGFPHIKKVPLAMMVLAVGMLLFGGGLFPPVLAFIMGLVAARIHARKRWWADKAPAGLQRFFARAWGWIFALCALAWLALFPGLNLLGYSFGVENEALTMAIILLALVTLVLTVISAYAHDAQRTD